ncbi:hypothetical protein HMI56_000800 [Coelomomyces lativittatus]|nr:hypothetical protein HMI56_000800 [Coelomomyces lativittatus]
MNCEKREPIECDVSSGHTMRDMEELEQKATDILLHRFPAKRHELLDTLANATIMNLPDPFQEFMKYMNPPSSKKRKKIDPESLEPLTSESLYPTNTILKSMVSLVAKELLTFMEMCNTVKVWLLVCILDKWREPFI